MSFRPVVPAAGLAGWRFLQRTRHQQLAAFSGSARAERDGAHFLERIAGVRNAAELVSDRRLLGVALGAFGLNDDLNNRAFILKVLEEGTSSPDALANRMTDRRYRRLSAAFGFGPAETLNTGNAKRMAAVLDLSRVTDFETAVGEQDETMRIALYAQRELPALAGSAGSDDAKWFSVMGLPPLRAMFETALGLPRTFGQIDIDQQLQVFRDRTGAATGHTGIAQFTDPAQLERLTNLYMARAQINAAGGAGSSDAIALTLLRTMTC
ncbi:MAG: DUF1217 domain-containing protein [Jhaorihella sp.]